MAVRIRKMQCIHPLCTESQNEAKHPSTARNELQSPFLRLPGELRNKIYEYVFYIGVFTFAARFSAYSKPGPNFFGRPTCEPHLFALLHVCKKTHSETADYHLPFSLNTFSFPLLYRMTAYYVHLQPVQLASITSIDIEVKLGTAHGIEWFVDGWKARGMGCLQNVMPGVRKVKVCFERSTTREQERIEKEEESILQWLRGTEDAGIELTLESDGEE
jgi:hypothetical protein